MKNRPEMFGEEILNSTIDELLPLVDLFDNEEEFMEHFMDSILFLETEELKDKTKGNK